MKSSAQALSPPLRVHAQRLLCSPSDRLIVSFVYASTFTNDVMPKLLLAHPLSLHLSFMFVCQYPMEYMSKGVMLQVYSALDIPDAMNCMMCCIQSMVRLISARVCLSAI